MAANALDFYRTPAAMTRLPEHPALDAVPSDLAAMRAAIQGLLVHRDWAPAYGVTGDAIRIDEQNLRSTREVLARAFELSSEPVTITREPRDRVLCICRHFTLLQTALLRSQDVPARVRCGFANYFDRSKWYDHWITERWDGKRWVRDDPQIDALQADVIKPDFDVNDQPPGQFLSGSEAWVATRAGELDPSVFGIFDMWGAGFIGGNVVTDFACLNNVELLPWDIFGRAPGPFDAPSGDDAAFLDDVAALANRDEFGAIRERYESDAGLRVPDDILTIVDGKPQPAHLDLAG